ncbi:MAG: hypothetical protein ACQER1_17605, partial [Armatimonadota bacterium]
MAVRTLRRLLPCVALSIMAAQVAAQPTDPGTVQQVDPSDYALLEADLPAGMSLPDGINLEGRRMALTSIDADGNIVEQDSRVLEVMQQIDIDGGDDHSVHMRVVILDSPERAQILAQNSVDSDLVGVNDLGDPRLSADGGSRVAPGWVFIRYRDVCARFNLIGRHDDEGGAHTERVARLWLDKVAGPPGADLSLDPDLIRLKFRSDYEFVEREPAADRQHVIAEI